MAHNIFPNSRNGRIGDHANFATVAGNQITNNNTGSGAQNNNNATGVQNVNYGRDQNLNHGGGPMTVNNRGGWTPPAYRPAFAPTGSGYSNNNSGAGTQNVNAGRDQNSNYGNGGFNITNDERTTRRKNSPPPTQPPIAESAARERREATHSPSNAHDQRPLSGKRLDGDELQREEDAFRDMRNDGDEYGEILDLKDEEAQDMLDDWQSLFENTGDAELRQQVVRAMSELTYRSGRVPDGIWIQEVEDLSQDAVEFGGFADIWTGSTNGTKVALKVVRHRINHKQHELMIKAFMREAVIWRSFVHANILPFKGMYWFKGNQEQICLVCPWMENGNLLQFLKKHPEIEPAAQERLASGSIDYAKEIAQGLAYLHSLKITHGDLKGYNVLIDHDQTARITDFGLSRVVDNENLAGLSNMSGRQGPIRWLAPELLKSGRKSAISLKSDVYAFGCVCYEIYAKRIPFEGTEDFGIMHAVVIQNKRPQPPQNMGDKMRNLMESCWLADPDSRPDAAKIVAQIDRPNNSRSEPGRLKPKYRNRNKV
ncbi:Rho guanine nucleotide exchange factor [Marasmius sp. AFHP31]|nr:Rho guanine nucleotide exchange factor [Marasmius sp. AFHP31]